jgi:hypothetical protein
MSSSEGHPIIWPASWQNYIFVLGCHHSAVVSHPKYLPRTHQTPHLIRSQGSLLSHLVGKPKLGMLPKAASCLIQLNAVMAHHVYYGFTGKHHGPPTIQAFASKLRSKAQSSPPPSWIAANEARAHERMHHVTHSYIGGTLFDTLRWHSIGTTK